MRYRESQLVNLIAELLGPRNGIDETFGINPVKDYVTGVLQPADYHPKNSMPEHHWIPDYVRNNGNKLRLGRH